MYYKDCLTSAEKRLEAKHDILSKIMREVVELENEVRKCKEDLEGARFRAHFAELKSRNA